MSLEFKNVSKIITPSGEVTKITRKSDNTILWQNSGVMLVDKEGYFQNNFKIIDSTGNSWDIQQHDNSKFSNYALTFSARYENRNHNLDFDIGTLDFNNKTIHIDYLYIGNLKTFNQLSFKGITSTGIQATLYTINNMGTYNNIEFKTHNYDYKSMYIYISYDITAMADYAIRLNGMYIK